MLVYIFAVFTHILLILPAFAYEHNTIKAKSHVCPDSSKNSPVVKSKNSDVATVIKFTNKTGASILTYWLDFKGDPVLYSEVESGSTVNQPTYVTHPWVIVTGDMECFGPFMPARRTRTVIVD
jgi:hypothetical protein